MKPVSLLIVCATLIIAGVTPSDAEKGPQSKFRLAQGTAGPRDCAQVVSCGTKDGKRKEYPTPCAAQDDGATNITPKNGPTCETSK
jgi:hypothetical protein